MSAGKGSDMAGTLLATEPIMEQACGAVPGSSQTSSSSSLPRIEPGRAMQPSAESKNYQSKLLKQINSMKTKEDVLAFVERTHYLLDTINLVTSVYRLARMFSSLQVIHEQKLAWKLDLLNQPSFSMLLGAIHSHVSQAHALVSTTGNATGTGMNARCLSNLIWSLVKLECVAEDGHPLALQVVSAASPLVLVFLEDCSGQGLANLLWSYAKIPVAHSDVMTAIVMRMVHLLQDTATASSLDAQALSNSIWAIAHVRSQPSNGPFAELEASNVWQGAVTHFLLLMAQQCSAMLNQLVDNLQVPRVQPQVVDNDQTFSCQVRAPDRRQSQTFSWQALVNIVWSFSTILGSACGDQEPIRPLFLFVRDLMIGKLRASVGGLQLHQPWVYSLSGSFNEQALAHLVYAYERAGLLNTALLQAVLDVVTQRLSRCSSHSLPFKPSELTILLRACHTGLADGMPFFTTLSRLLAQNLFSTQTWTPAEAADVAKGMQVLRAQAANMMMQRQQQQRAANTMANHQQQQQQQQQGLHNNSNMQQQQQQQQQQQALLNNSNMHHGMAGLLLQQQQQRESMASMQQQLQQQRGMTELLRQQMQQKPIQQLQQRLSGPAQSSAAATQLCMPASVLSSLSGSHSALSGSQSADCVNFTDSPPMPGTQLLLTNSGDHACFNSMQPFNLGSPHASAFGQSVSAQQLRQPDSSSALAMGLSGIPTPQNQALSAYDLCASLTSAEASNSAMSNALSAATAAAAAQMLLAGHTSSLVPGRVADTNALLQTSSGPARTDQLAQLTSATEDEQVANMLLAGLRLN